MKCPNCQREIEDGLKECPHCGAELTPRPGLVKRILTNLFWWILILAALFLGGYKLYFGVDAYRFNKQYERGQYAPTLAEVIMDDGRQGHSITYYGSDGDRIFFDVLNETIVFSGNVAQLEIPDSYWFGGNVEENESAEVSLAPVLIYENGDKRRLPALEFTVNAPQSPLQIISPAQDDLSVNTSIYPLEVQVVPGSTVMVNGRDLTDIVDRSGLLSANVNVFPVGDNVYTIIVRTPNHRETRQDILIYRAEMEIAVELDTNIPTSSNSDVVTISGKCDPGATISVDSPYMEDSIIQNDETGSFTFLAQMTAIGDNVVRFRATYPGKADSVINVTVNYLPPLNEYSRKAWAMDYEQLSQLFEQWNGKIFQCDGDIVDIVYEDDTQYVVMNVGTGDIQQLVVLENLSSEGTPSRGERYRAYADVSGRYIYNSHYCPMLKARYMEKRSRN